MKNKGRIFELDALRGLAVLAVIFFHYTFKYNSEYNPTRLEDSFNFQYGHFGVEFFFIISGYVIFMTVEKIKTARQFIWLRFTRLFPVYWTGVVLTFVLVSLVGLPGREVVFKAFLFNFTMLQDLFQIPNVDGAYWSLLPELMFYLAMLILILFGLKKHVRFFALIWLGFIFSALIFTYPTVITQVLNLKYGMLFIAGIQFYLLKSDAENRTNNLLSICILAISLLSAFFLYEDKLGFGLISLFFALFACLHFGWLKIISVKPLVFIGAISYPLYIIHQNIGYLILNKLSLNPLLEVLIAILVLVCLASLIHYLVEKPSIKVLRNIFKKSE